MSILEFKFKIELVGELIGKISEFSIEVVKYAIMYCNSCYDDLK
jgi:hypothetical protein